MEKQIEIRDARKRQMFRIDDLYIDQYARFCGVNATAVYSSLCRHVNGRQESFPSIERIMEQHGFGSHNTVRKAIKALETHGVITVRRERHPKTKRQMVNVYTLMDSSSWKKPMSNNDSGADVILDTDPMSFRDKKPVSPNDMEGYTEEKVTHRRNVAKDATPPVAQCKDEKCTNPPMKNEEFCKIHKSMNLEQFAKWCAKSPHRHIQIIGEWAETVAPGMVTVAQWDSFITRNLKPASLLAPFSPEQIMAGFEKIEAGISAGWLTDYTLETLFKKVTEISNGKKQGEPVQDYSYKQDRRTSSYAKDLSKNFKK